MTASRLGFWPRRSRLLLAVGTALVLGLAVGTDGVAASAAGHGSGGRIARVSFPRYGLSARFPSAWKRVDWCWSGANVIPIALLTTARATPVCAQPAVGAGASFPPAERLGRDGTSVDLALQAILPGAKTTWNGRVGGQPAHIARPAYAHMYRGPVTCPAGVRREYRSVAVKRPASMNELLVVGAVLCGPHLAAGDAAIDRMLASIRFKT